MNSQLKPILIGNVYGKSTHGGYGMDIFHPDGICRCLNATVGGASQTLVMIEYPMILSTQRTEEAKQLRRVNGDVGVKYSGSKEYTVREDNMSNTITTVEKDNLLLEPQTCAVRTRSYVGKPATLETGGNVANAITSVYKDSMVLEPQVIQKVGDRGTDNYSVHGYANTIPANPMSDRGQLLVEPKIIGYTRDSKGKVIGHHLKDESNTLHTGGGTTEQYVAEPVIKRVANIYPSKGQGGVVVDTKGIAPAVCECHGEVTRILEPLRIRQATAQGYVECPVGGVFDAAYPSSKNRRGRVQQNGEIVGAITSQADNHCVYEGGGTRTIAYKTMPNGNIRAYDPNTDDKRGISESQITNPNNESPTITSTQTPKIIMNQQVQYRIRKLTPVETGRLMGIDDADIHKMLDPKDEKGKPLISKSQAYKLHGNSIVVDVLFHIFRTMFIDTKSTKPIQPTLF